MVNRLNEFLYLHDKHNFILHLLVHKICYKTKVYTISGITKLHINNQEQELEQEKINTTIATMVQNNSSQQPVGVEDVEDTSIEDDTLPEQTTLSYLQIYNAHFRGEVEIDDTLKTLLLQENWQAALEHSYIHEYVKIFKCLYLYTSCKFPIDFMIQMQEIIGTECGHIYKPRLNRPQLELQLSKLVIKEETRQKYGRKMDMIGFIANCRAYSCHVYTGCKFYYYFKRDKYQDRIDDILRDM